MGVLDGKLSIAIIAKNEEVMIKNCILSVQKADEIVLVDTGSTDKTVDIASPLVDKLYHYPWDDDFATARNFAKEHCSHAWILSIDADERLEKGGIRKIRKLIRHADVDAFDVKLTSAYAKKYFNFPRLFSNASYIYWKGKAHNYLSIRRGQPTNITITEYRSPAHEKDPNRTRRILEEAIKEDPTLVREKFYLALEYIYRGLFLYAIDLLIQHQKACTFEPELAESYLTLAKIYRLNSVRLAKEKTLQAIAINPNFKEAIEFLSYISENPEHKKQWKNMAKKANNKDVLFIRGVSWLDLED